MSFWAWGGAATWWQGTSAWEAAGLWRFGVKGAHRQLFTARASAMREQGEGPMPGWMDSLGEDDWVYGTWETETSELRLYRSLHAMLEVLVPPAEVFDKRVYSPWTRRSRASTTPVAANCSACPCNSISTCS